MKDAEDFVQSVLDRGKPYEAEAEEVRISAMACARPYRPGRPAQRSGRSTVDFDALVAGAASNQADFEASGPLFIVFASLSMPKEALARLIADTSTAGGMVVFRGFPGNDAKAFVAGMKGVLSAPEQQAHIAIDPRLFRAFAVRAAPTFVVVSSEFELCEGLKCDTTLPAHDRMMGNVSVEYALETLCRRARPRGSHRRNCTRSPPQG